MTWQSVICFKLPALACLLAHTGAAATVSGQVEVAGPAGQKDASGVVVMLEPESGPMNPLATRARMLQKNKMFVPHMLAVPVGSTVDFPNFDPIFHNAFSNFNGQVFDIGLYPPGKSRSVVLRRAGIVRVFCNIHPTMSAIIVAVDTPYFAVTDRAGKYAIGDVPAGSYRREVFYERATPESLAALQTGVEVHDVDLPLPLTRISETGYLPMPHMNKYGKAYPHGSGEDSGYGVPVP